MIIAVDGPAGAGKSSVCSAVCEAFGWTYVNTGALYRAVAVLAFDRGVDLVDEGNLCQIAQDLVERSVWEPKTATLSFEGGNLNHRIQSQVAGSAASSVAKLASVRKALLPLQRRLALECETGALLEGRDIGTVVFPDAHVKIYMTASLEERARRRFEQLKSGKSMVEADFEVIKTEIARRDQQDSARIDAPMRKADDALLFDTTGLGPDEAKEALIALLRTHLSI